MAYKPQWWHHLRHHIRCWWHHFTPSLRILSEEKVAEEKTTSFYVVPIIPLNLCLNIWHRNRKCFQRLRFYDACQVCHHDTEDDSKEISSSLLQFKCCFFSFRCSRKTGEKHLDTQSSCQLAYTLMSTQP